MRVLHEDVETGERFLKCRAEGVDTSRGGMRTSLFCHLVGFHTLMLAADKGGGSGGSAAKTDLEKLQDAEAEVKTLKSDLEKAQTAKIEAEKGEAAAEKLGEEAEQKLAAAVKEKTELADKLTKAEAEVTKLTGEAKSADKRAQEIAASHGSKPAAKDTEAAAGGASDGKALYDAYTKLDGLEASEFWAKHSKALIAFGEAEEKKARQRD